MDNLEITPSLSHRLVSPSPKENNPLFSGFEKALFAIHDEKVKKHAENLFRAGGFLYETQSLVDKNNSNGLVLANHGDTKFTIGFFGEIVWLHVDDPRKDEIAEIDLARNIEKFGQPNNFWRFRETQPGGIIREAMASKDADLMVQSLLQAQLDPVGTKKAVVDALGTIIRSNFFDTFGKKIGDNMLFLGNQWGDFYDTKRSLIHPQWAPKDAIYDFSFFEEPENLLEQSLRDWKSQITSSFYTQLEELLGQITMQEGITGHQVINLSPGNERFQMVPTKRGIDLYQKLRTAIPIMLQEMDDEKLQVIFDDIDPENKSPDWSRVMTDVRYGVEDGYTKDLTYVREKPKPEKWWDKIDIEFENRWWETRGFRLLAQVLAQKQMLGWKWRRIRSKAQALMDLAEYENVSTEEVIKKYGF